MPSHPANDYSTAANRCGNFDVHIHKLHVVWVKWVAWTCEQTILVLSNYTTHLKGVNENTPV